MAAAQPSEDRNPAYVAAARIPAVLPDHGLINRRSAHHCAHQAKTTPYIAFQGVSKNGDD
jgi:hypothetical protein